MRQPGRGDYGKYQNDYRQNAPQVEETAWTELNAVRSSIPFFVGVLSELELHISIDGIRSEKQADP